MANKALVISEPMYDPAPYVPGRHFISAPLEEMPALIRYYLDNESERSRIVEEAYRFATTEHTMERAIGRILAIVCDWARDRGDHRLG
jgi:spore maturation protein CgeB